MAGLSSWMEMPPAGGIAIHGRRPVIGELAEQATDDLGAGAVVVHGGQEVGEAVAEVVHLPVQALDVAARLLEQLRGRRLHAQFTSHLISFVTSIDATYANMYVGLCASVVRFRLCSECNARTRTWLPPRRRVLGSRVWSLEMSSLISSSETPPRDLRFDIVGEESAIEEPELAHYLKADGPEMKPWRWEAESETGSSFIGKSRPGGGWLPRQPLARAQDTQHDGAAKDTQLWSGLRASTEQVGRTRVHVSLSWSQLWMSAGQSYGATASHTNLALPSLAACQPSRLHGERNGQEFVLAMAGER
jgi:hypothetical protein